MGRKNVLYIAETDSTNARLKELAAKGAEHGSVLIADRQTKGRGRLGRSFESPEGGIYLSILWRPDCKAEDTLSITPLAALAVRRAVKKAAGLDAGIKWPNDLMINGKKVCGILTEMFLSADAKPAVIVGIGLNVNSRMEDFSENIRADAGSLYTEGGKTWDKRSILHSLIAELDAAYEAWEKNKSFFLEEYRENCLNIGKNVLVIRGGAAKKALALAVNDDFSLKVRYEDGKEENISYGEVSIRDR